MPLHANMNISFYENKKAKNTLTTQSDKRFFDGKSIAKLRQPYSDIYLLYICLHLAPIAPFVVYNAAIDAPPNTIYCVVVEHSVLVPICLVKS